MSGPATVQVGPLTFQIEHVRDLRGSEDQKLYGNISYDEGKIMVVDPSEPWRRELVLWHEVLHAILEVSGLDRVLGGAEEEFVKTFAYHLVDVLHRNETEKWGE